MRTRASIAALLALAWLVGGAPPAAGQTVKLTRYESKYYILHTDLDRDTVREALQRITAMAEEYADRTRGFAGRITKKMPFYLFANAEDYYRKGGMPGSAGVFDGEKLMAIADKRMGDSVWSTVQHEGFHQFVHAVIRGEIPIWVNEGLAEYFGEALFTGDGYVTGVVPPARAQRIKQWIKQGNALSIKGMMRLSHESWNNRLSAVNYDQAWSMVHFLAHARNGKYQEAFNAFLREVGRGVGWEQAWAATFGHGTKEFEAQWKTYWSEMPDDATADLYARATVATMTSLYARAFSQKQIFESADDFLAAARVGELRQHADDWLPRSMSKRAAEEAAKLGAWSIVKKATRYELVCEVQGGKTLVGTFQVTGGGRVKSGSVAVKAAK